MGGIPPLGVDDEITQCPSGLSVPSVRLSVGVVAPDDDVDADVDVPDVDAPDAPLNSSSRSLSPSSARACSGTRAAIGGGRTLAGGQSMLTI